jgi:CheY-like chemotaxis protein
MGAQHPDLRHHFGISIMSERAQRLGGNHRDRQPAAGRLRACSLLSFSHPPRMKALVSEDSHQGHAGRRPHPVPQGPGRIARRRDNIRVAAATGNPAEAARLLARRRPDVLVLDLNMPPHGGLSLLRELQGRGWSKPTLILTVSDAEDDLANAMRAGARGYLLKDMEPDDVVDAMQRAVRGETVVAPAMTLKLVNLLQGGGNAGMRRATTC